MGTTDLTHILTRASALVLALTLLGVLAGVIDPGLVATPPPHPALTGTITEALSILAANARTLAIPFAFALLGLGDSRPGRLTGNLGVLALTAISTLNVGLALGRWGARLLPYIPQLPLEWAALALAITAWLHTRNQLTSRRALIPLAIVTALLLILAAAVETWATPHRPATDEAVDAIVSLGGSRRQTGPANFAGASAGGRRTTINPRPPGGDHMNSVTLTGRLTSNPVSRSTASGAKVTSIRLAVPRPRRDGADQGADYVDITVFGRQAETCVEYLSKGRRVAIDGHLHHSEWDSDNGRRQKLEVVARNVEFLDRAPTGQEEQAPEEVATA